MKKFTVSSIFGVSKKVVKKRFYQKEYLAVLTLAIVLM